MRNEELIAREQASKQPLREGDTVWIKSLKMRGTLIKLLGQGADVEYMHRYISETHIGYFLYRDLMRLP